MQSRWRSRVTAPLAAGTVLAWLVLPGAEQASAAGVTGVCPDGSIFIVQSEAQIPCARSKRIEPSEVPPLRPEFLPSPYTWQVWQQQQNPNNPYNLIDSARQVRGLQPPPSAVPGAPGTAAAATGVSAAPPAVSSPPPPDSGGVAGATAAPAAAPVDLGLTEQDLRDLFLIVELSQSRTAARFQRETADGRGVFQVSLARSQAFEARLREAWRSRGGLAGNGVLIFSAVSQQPQRFLANFSFVQGHLSYQPDASDPSQVGILQGRLGELEAGEAVLGYVVLPEAMSASEPLDIYWNDRRTTARFPGRERG